MYLVEVKILRICSLEVCSIKRDLHMEPSIGVILYEPILILKLINILLQEW